MSSSCLGVSLPFSPKTAKKMPKVPGAGSLGGKKGVEKRLHFQLWLKFPRFTDMVLVPHMSPELGSSHCRPNQHDLQRHSHTYAG